ncbi:MAG: trigger factor [Betaproteobacteria bacterium]
MSTIEVIEGLQRRVALSVSTAELEQRATSKLRQLARTAKMQGFRPGKVPMKMIESMYGGSTRSEILSDLISEAFAKIAQEQQLRVAGTPDVSPEGELQFDGPSLQFSALFEVYPEVSLGPVGELEVERIHVQVGEAEIDKTVEVLRKQRTTWTEVDRPPVSGDQVTIDFRGTLDGIAFDGGSAEGFSVVLGEGRMLPDFEKGLLGQPRELSLHFPVQFPENYGAEQLAGKLANFEATIHRVEEPVLPAIDAVFAQQLGVADGDLEKLRAEIRKNLEREVTQRVKARIKAAVMDALPKVSSFDLPKALVETEVDTLAERAKQDLAQRGIDVKQMPIPREAFEDSAKKRVQLGLIVSELVKREKLQPKPEQVRAIVEEAAASYENPAEVIRYYFSDRQRLAEIEALAIEQNVVDYVLQHARVSDKDLAFDELMQQAA